MATLSKKSFEEVPAEMSIEELEITSEFERDWQERRWQILCDNEVQGAPICVDAPELASRYFPTFA